MKKLLFVCISVILLSSCDLLLELLGGLGGSKAFYARDLTKSSNDPNYFYRISANLLAENEYCKVYAETTSGVTEATAKKMANAYSVIHNKMEAAFGLEFEVEYTNGSKGVLKTLQYADAYTDGDGKLTILLLDIKDGYVKGVRDSYVAGYFSPYDFFSGTYYPYSNKCDMIYIDTYPAVPGDDETNSTLAHELQHLMNFTTSLNNRLVYEGEEVTDINLMDTWIDEGLASAAEWIYSNGTHLESRYGWYKYNGRVDKDGNKLLTGKIDMGNNFFVWDNRDHEASCGNANNNYANCKDTANHSQYAILDDYATVYLFFQWLRIQSNNGQNIYKEIIGSSKGDYMAVTDAASARISSSYNNWGRLLGDWLAANYINNSGGAYGYKTEISSNDISAHYFPVTGANARASLYPGEGVYSRINSTYYAPTNSGNIKYSLLTSNNVFTSGSIPSGALLTYNINTVNDIDGDFPSPENGIVTGVAADVNIAVPAQGRSITAGSYNRPYRIGAGDVQRGWFRDFPLDGVLQLPNSLTIREE